MPVYTYRCEKGHKSEVFQRITDEPIRKCRAIVRDSGLRCGYPCKKQISEGTSFALKGGGWADEGYS